MKKKSLFSFMLILVLSLATSVSAMAASGLSAAEESILAKLRAGVEVNGQVVEVPAAYINQAENEFMKNDVDVTADQAEVINSKIDEVAQIAKEENITKASDLATSGSVDELVAIVQEAAAVVDYTVAYDAASGIVSVTDPSGTEVFTTKSVINQTGFDMTAPVVVGGVLVTLLAACLVIASKKKLFVSALEA